MANPIYIDTELLSNYGMRIQNINSRITQLNQRIRKLYYTGLVNNISSFVFSNRFYSDIRTLSSCKSYIDSTVRDFEWIENYFASVDPLSCTDSNIKKLSNLSFTQLKLQPTTHHGLLGFVLSLVCSSGITNCGSSGATSRIKPMQNGKGTFSTLSGISKGVGKLGNNDAANLSSKALNYLGDLGDVIKADGTSSKETSSGLLNLFSSSTNLEKGIFDYYIKKLHPYEAAKLDDKFGKGIFTLSVLSGIAGTANEALETHDVFTDSNSNNFDKTAQAITTGGSIFNTAGNIYVANQAKTKTLQIISSADDSKRIVNQILSTEQKLSYTSSKAASEKISKANTVLAVGEVLVSTASGGIKRAGQVTEDGDFNLGDAGSVMVYASADGLETVINKATFGVVNFDGEKVALDLESDASDFVRGDSWAAEYIRDKNNNVVLRFGVSVGSGACIVAQNAVEGVVNGVTNAGNWIYNRYSDIACLFK